MVAKRVGSRSMKMAPDSSLRVEMRPDKSDVKNVSGIQVKVWREVLNLIRTLQYMLALTDTKYSKW